MKPKELAKQSLIWTLIFEAITCLLRFGAKLESTRDTASTIGRVTMGVRIHHSYIGLAMIPLAMWIENRWPNASRTVLCMAIGLVLSDLIHHFIVLWWITGSPQFDLFY
ncbi:MAG: hypothetical protein R3C20_01950 [Planctomycetaceae bacterium]